MYFPNKYPRLNEKKIKQDALQEGFEVSMIEDKPGFVYQSHKHKETKYLVFIYGTMDVSVENKQFHCVPGDQLIIPSNTQHSAIVGPLGCHFYWSEKVVK